MFHVEQMRGGVTNVSRGTLQVLTTVNLFL
jgi:hypothetical protein